MYIYTYIPVYWCISVRVYTHVHVHTYLKEVSRCPFNIKLAAITPSVYTYYYIFIYTSMYMYI